MPFPLQVPVLITAFSRYDTLREVFLAVRKARPPRIYFACDGPRNHMERLKCEKVRSLIELVDWDCELNTLFHEKNMGCRAAMVANLNWFFSKEEEGIILEDDVVPDVSFFPFCQSLLRQYRNDTHIWAIVGNNLSASLDSKASDSYWFSGHGCGAYWGWASWRRVWERFDVDMKEWPRVRETKEFHDWFLSDAERKEVYKLFDHTYNGNTTWDYQFDFAKILSGAVNLIPESNLCRNIGFGADGTHTVKLSDSRNTGGLQQVSFPLRHPDSTDIDPVRDLAYFNRHILPSRYERIKALVKGALPYGVEKRLTPIVSSLQRRLGLG